MTNAIHAVYVTSTHTFSGKSALCIGLLHHFQSLNLRTGYMKPVSVSSKMPSHVPEKPKSASYVDEDTLSLKEQFAFKDPLADMCPVTLSDHLVEGILKGEVEIDFQQTVSDAFQNIKRDRDMVVLEGGASLREAWLVDLSPPHIAELLGVKILVVVPYGSDLQVLDDIITSKVRFGQNLLGVVINRVPKHRLNFVNNLAKPYIENHGIACFAVIPKDRLLMSVSVGEIVDGLGGEVLCASDHLDELVENLMVGAMSVDSALRYFRRKPNKAVITGGDRADIQLAALETSTKCLVLTGNMRPNPIILGRAEAMGVPIILTQLDTMATVDNIEIFFGKTRFHQKRKVNDFIQLFNKQMDFARLEAALGLR